MSTCQHPPDRLTRDVDHGRAIRCRVCGHRVWDLPGRTFGNGVYEVVKLPRQTRYSPSRWLTEWWRRGKARRMTWPA